MKKTLSLLLTLCVGLFVGATLTACDDDSASSVNGGDSSVSSVVGGTTDDSSDSSTQQHQHNFATEWSKNETEHWHACLGADCTDVSDKSAHAYGAWTDAGKSQHQKTCVCGQAIVENCVWNAGEITTEATCEDGGVKTFTCTKCGATKTENFGELGHDYSVSIVWTGVTAQANVVCLNDAEHNDTVAATVTSAETPATCGANKETAYTATVTFDGRTYTDVKTVVQENTALGHDFALSEWQWTEYSVAKAVFVCARNAAHTQEVTAEITSATTNPTCTTDGATVYTATATLNEQPYTDTKTQTLGKTGHDFAFDSFEWANDFTSARAKLVCQNDETHIQRETVEAIATPYQPTCTEDGYTVYSVLYRYDEITNQDSKTVTHEGTATGHDYENRGWSWANDYTSATVSLYCLACEQAFPTAATVTSETTNPTCSQAGSTVYTASVTVNGETYTDTETVTLPAAHDIVNGVCTLCGYRESVGLEYAETDGGYKVTGRGTCTDAEIYIPESYQGQPVVAIAQYAFLNQTDITLFKVPSSVTLIDIGAFKGCSALKELTLPFVGRSANDSYYYYIGYIFGASGYDSNMDYTPASLQKLIITGGKVASNALYSCNNVKEIHILEGATVQIGSPGSKEGGLNNCTSVERLTLPQGYSTSASFYLGSYFGGTYTNWVTAPSTLKFLSIRGGQYANISNFADNYGQVSELILGNSLTHAGIITNKVVNLYYEGTEEEYNALSSKPNNYNGRTTIYYYSEEEPTEEGNFWHWAADGVTPIPWAMSGTWTLVSLTMENPSTEIVPGENGVPLNYVVFDLKADGTFTQTVNATDATHTIEGTWVLSSVYGYKKIFLTPADTSNGGTQEFSLNSDGTMTCTTVVSGASQTIVLKKVEFLGTYKFVSQTFTLDGQTQEFSVGTVMGEYTFTEDSIVLEFKADGTLVYTANSPATGQEVLNGTWTRNGDTVSITINSDTQTETDTGTLDGNTLTITNTLADGDSMTLVLRKVS